MPQLMPFVWINSVFMSFLLMFVLMLMYSYIENLFSFEVEEVNMNKYMVSW